MTTLMKTIVSRFAAPILLAGSVLAQNASFYKETPLFSTAPDPAKSTCTIERFGPVGMGIELIQPAFTMRIRNIEPGSPAEAAGMLKPGQIIESVNGAALKDIDPRIQLGNVITDAEAKDGVIRLKVADHPGGPAREVVVRIPVLGSYSKTWPLNCPKSDKIVRGHADWLAKPESGTGFGHIGMLFLLGTGEERDIEPVRKWVHSLADKKPSSYSWFLGLGGVPLCEYYLRTGDAAALPIIQKWVDSAVAGEYLGGWSQKGIAGSVTYGGGGGHLNAGGTAVVTFLMLAKECGASIPDDTFHRVLSHFYRWAGRGNNSYGDGRPEYGLVDNGKNGNLAFAMAAAAALTPDGGISVYAGARDAAALTGFYTTTYMLHGHTGGGIGEIWRSAAMGLLYEKTPRQYRDFMDQRRWHYELSRRFDGSFGILGGARYDNTSWGAAYPLTYIVPRKTLRITGAPPTKFSKPYKLPERPWGTAADDAFASIRPAALADGTRPDFSDETLAKDSGIAMLARLNAENVDDEMLRRCAHHPDHFVRLVAARRVMGVGSAYLGKPSGSGPIRRELAMELFRSPDARVRRAIVDAMGDRLSGGELMEFLGHDGFGRLIAMLRDPAESWWVKDAVLNLVGRAPADAVVPHADLLLGFLKHEEWWLQNAALAALSPVAADPRCYAKVVPAIGEMARTCERWNATNPLRWGTLRDKLRNAAPEVQKLIAVSFRDAQTGYAGAKTAPGGLDISRVHNSHKDFLATALAEIEGGYDLLYEIGKRENPDNPLKQFGNVFLAADSGKFGPELKKAYEPLMRSQVIPAYIGNNRADLLWEAVSGAAEKRDPRTRLVMPGLVHLYNQLGVTDYNWRDFGPKWTEMNWHYLTFDPPEKLALDAVRWRYRPVTCPPGMENWFEPGFDPAKAGWKTGRQPFGQYGGKLVTDRGSCVTDFCRHGEPMQTLWDKEVLLLSGKFQFPKFKEGHNYRLLIGGMSHVGSGDGFRVYINGKQLVERPRGIDKREGGNPVGALLITREWWPEFDREVTIAATSFLAYGSKATAPGNPVPQGNFSLWLQEMKVPPLGGREVLVSTTVVPMFSSEWQALQDPDNNDLNPEEGKFQWDGRFITNPKLTGAWKTIGYVTTVEAFDPAKPKEANRASMQVLDLKSDGTTGDPLVIWSGDMVMNLRKNEALKMRVESLDGTEFLFIEAGGFQTKNSNTWKCPWFVMKRQ